MFNKIEGATKEIIHAHDNYSDGDGYAYECWLPQMGFGINASTGEIEKTDVLKRDTKKSEQFWQRTDLPKDWVKLRKEELRRQNADDEYFNQDLERYRQQEWGRRLRGIWFYNNGVPTYITGLHYFYLNWWKIDIGYPEYRNSDRKFFYVLDYCIEDPRCGMLIEATKRRQGKTYRGGCFLYEGVSRTSEVEGGIQSKTATDAKTVVFQKAIVSPFKKLPDFFRPTFDTSKGITPTSELRFAHTTIKGKRALDILDRPELNSVIDWASSDVYGYDGRKKFRLFEDEIGKTAEANVYERSQVTRYCLETDGKWTGFALKSTTVEDMESGGAEFKMIWDESDPTKRDKNGHTATGGYRYMTPAYETLFFDKYGNPDIEKGKEYFLNRRAGLAHNPRALASEIRKNPFNAREMFRIDGDKCWYDSMLLNDRRDDLSTYDNYIEKGNFEWVEKYKEVRWTKSQNGRWKLCKGFQFDDESHRNNVTIRSNTYRPNNQIRYIAAVDPYDHKTTKDNRRSNAAAYVKKRYAPGKDNDPYNEAYICEYCARPSTPEMMYDDILKMCFYFGCELLVETQKPGLMTFFRTAGFEPFLMILPGEREPGIAASVPNTQVICQLTESYIFNNINKVYFIDLLDDWLQFDPDNTTAFDRAMAWGYTEIADKYKILSRNHGKIRDITEIFPSHKINTA